MAHAPLAGSLGLTPFYDCSWTLYHCFWKKSAVRDGLLAESSRGRERLARRLEEALKNMREESDEDEEPDQRSSRLAKFSVELLSTRNINGVSAGISVTANYERGSEHKFIFIDDLGARVNRLPLLLIKAPAGVAKKVSAVLSIDVAVGLLKLPSSALETTLESYLIDLHGQSSDLCKSVIRDIKVTFSVQAPVSPELRSIDIDLPAESVCAILNSHRSSSFLEQLAVHLQRHTGLKIPHDTAALPNEHPISISRVVCNAFALSTDGRLKLTKRAADAADAMTMKSAVEALDQQLLDTFAALAAKESNR